MHIFICMYMCYEYIHKALWLTHKTNNSTTQLKHEQKTWTDNIRMANKHMRRYLSSLAIGEVQIKASMRYDYTLTRMVKIQRLRITTFSKVMSITCGWWEYKTVQLLWETTEQFFMKLNILLPSDLAISFLGIYPREMKTCKDFYTNIHS